MISIENQIARKKLEDRFVTQKTDIRAIVNYKRGASVLRNRSTRVPSFDLMSRHTSAQAG